ncbi:hypothetical protein [Lacticaseibacillus paracasei]|nr:hypothetical protein [Lacticaseibacillus paracasei]
MRKAKIIRTRQVVSPLLTLFAAVALSGVTTVHALTTLIKRLQ